MSKILNVDENKYIKEAALMQIINSEMYIKEEKIDIKDKKGLGIIIMSSVFAAIDDLISDGVLKIIKK